MAIRAVVSDFDGVWTLVEEEGRPYREGYILDLATLSGFTLDRVRGLVAHYEAEVAANPGAFGWNIDGQIVAPANVDPYLRMKPVADMVMAASGLEIPRVLYERLFGGGGLLFRKNYENTATAFRPGARRAMLALSERGHFDIVTNSTPTKVLSKLRTLRWGTLQFERIACNVNGNAAKYMVVADSVPVPKRIDIPGLDRPVLTHRPRYFQILDFIRGSHDLEWSEMAVVGDIFELDLALPYVLGCRVILLANDHTPAYERAFLAASPNGHVVEKLSEVLDRLD